MIRFEELETDDANLKALDLILAAWDEGVDTGVAPEQMAYAALFTALTDLVAIYGEDAVIKAVKGEMHWIAAGVAIVGVLYFLMLRLTAKKRE